MSEERLNEERPCLHCMMVGLIDDFLAEYPQQPYQTKSTPLKQMK